ncbi:type II secretion system protein, partial [Vibrio splendidus]
FLFVLYKTYQKEYIYMQIKKGMTLIESLLVLAVTGTASAAFIKQQSSSAENDNIEKIAVEFSQILNAIDTKIELEGYADDHWSKLSFNKNEFSNFLIEELTAKGSKCKGKWQPTSPTESDTALINCGLWQSNTPFGLEPRIDFKVDTNNFISEANVLLKFTDEKSFYENVNKIRRVLTKTSKSFVQKTGRHSTTFVDVNTKNNLTSTECLRKSINCAISLNYERSGGFESLGTDGRNSMVGDHLTFIEAVGQTPLTCVRWYKDNFGEWQSNGSEECGIGIYNGTNSPVMVDLVVENGTFEGNLVLDKTCDNLFYNTVTNQVEKNGTIPCGFISETELISVVENSIAKQGVFDVVNTNNLNAKSINTKSLNVKDGNFDTMTVNNKLDVLGLTTLDELVVHDETKFEGEVTFKQNSVFEKNVDINGVLNVNQDIIANNISVRKNIKATSIDIVNLTASGVITAKMGKIENYDNEILKIKRDIQRLSQVTNPATPPPKPKPTYKWKLSQSFCLDTFPGNGVYPTPNTSCSVKGKYGFRVQHNNCGKNGRDNTYYHYICE